MKIKVLLMTLCLSIVVGCAQVPKEVVELSYQMGQDMSALHASYDKLIQARFEDFRNRRKDYLENTWKPDYLKRWVKNGRLIDVANGKVVWSFKKKGFVAPTPGKADAQLLLTIEEWAKVAINEIQLKEKKLLSPLDEQEKALRGEVKDAFDRVIKANAHVTAHLNSLRKVKEIEDEALEALKLKDLRDKITGKLAEISRKAEDGLEKIKKTDGILDKALSIKRGE